MSGKVKKIKVGDDFHILSVSGPSRLADQVSEQVERAAERARAEARRQMKLDDDDANPDRAQAAG